MTKFLKGEETPGQTHTELRQTCDDGGRGWSGDLQLRSADGWQLPETRKMQGQTLPWSVQRTNGPANNLTVNEIVKEYISFVLSH